MMAAAEAKKEAAEKAEEEGGESAGTGSNRRKLLSRALRRRSLRRRLEESAESGTTETADTENTETEAADVDEDDTDDMDLIDNDEDEDVSTRKPYEAKRQILYSKTRNCGFKYASMPLKDKVTGICGNLSEESLTVYGTEKNLATTRYTHSCNRWRKCDAAVRAADKYEAMLMKNLDYNPDLPGATGPLAKLYVEGCRALSLEERKMSKNSNALTNIGDWAPGVRDALAGLGLGDMISEMLSDGIDYFLNMGVDCVSWLNLQPDLCEASEFLTENVYTLVTCTIGGSCPPTGYEEDPSKFLDAIIDYMDEMREEKMKAAKAKKKAEEKKKAEGAS
jgi:hypothetical protein